MSWLTATASAYASCARTARDHLRGVARAVALDDRDVEAGVLVVALDDRCREAGIGTAGHPVELERHGDGLGCGEACCRGERAGDERLAEHVMHGASSWND
jgi:hypothetical protein